MALLRRPSAQFFAVFYRWNIYTQQTVRCNSSASILQREQPQESLDSSRPPIEPQPESKIWRSTPLRDSSGDYPEKVIPTLKATPKLGRKGAGTRELGLSDGVRALMRKVPSSVAVITAAHHHKQSQTDVPLGVAVSSLTTVTLDPPTISFNLKKPSRAIDAIEEAGGHFRVHFLGADRQGANIVDLFSKGNNVETWNQRREALDIHTPDPTTKADAGRSQAPLIREESVQAVMECSITHRVPVADHILFVASIDDLQSKVLQDYTLMYVDGEFKHPNASTIHLKDPAVTKD